jgi:peptidoglycan biosynthesis/recognition FemAB-like protein
MAYTYRLFNSIDEVDLTSWQCVRSACGERLFMDPRLIAATELGMGQSCKFWHVIVDDEQGRPVACASLTAITIDMADFADPRLATLVRRLPGVFARLRNLKVLLCGLPVSAGQNNLALVRRSASHEILSVLDRAICRLALAHGMHGIAYKEFAQNDLEWTSPLLTLGYRRISSLPMNLFKPSFPDFQHYCAALRSRYRQKIKRSLRKRRQAGIEVSVLSDAREIARAYTPQVHDLYCQVVDRADVKLEKLPIGFFYELARRFDGEIDLIILSKDARIVAFGWALHVRSAYHLLFDGLDYQLNAESDLYFNLMYAGLDRALRKRVSKIYVGQAADAFKARMGCYSEPLYAFVKGLGPVMSPFVRYGANLLLARNPPVFPLNIFRSEVPDNAEQAGPSRADRRRSVSRVA